MPEEWNWDENKLFYYVLHHEKRAFIVRAMNKWFAVKPYVAAVKGTPDGEYNISVSTWPGAKPYQQ